MKKKKKPTAVNTANSSMTWQEYKRQIKSSYRLAKNYYVFLTGVKCPKCGYGIVKHMDAEEPPKERYECRNSKCDWSEVI